MPDSTYREAVAESSGFDASQAISIDCDDNEETVCIEESQPAS